MYHYPANQLAALVRAPRIGAVGAQSPPGMMVHGGGYPTFAPYPWPRPSGAPNLPPPVSYTPPPVSVGDCGNGIPQCPPVDPAVANAMAAMACQRDAQMMQRAYRAASLNKLPQSALGVTTDNRTPGATPSTGTNGAVPAGGTHTILVRSSVPFCITDLEVARTATPFFWISSIRFAQREYMADGGAHGDGYAPDSNHPLMEFPTLWPGTAISFVIINLDAAERQFYGHFSGISLGAGSPCL